MHALAAHTQVQTALIVQSNSFSLIPLEVLALYIYNNVSENFEKETTQLF